MLPQACARAYGRGTAAAARAAPRHHGVPGDGSAQNTPRPGGAATARNVCWQVGWWRGASWRSVGVLACVRARQPCASGSRAEHSTIAGAKKCSGAGCGRAGPQAKRESGRNQKGSLSVNLCRLRLPAIEAETVRASSARTEIRTQDRPKQKKKEVCPTAIAGCGSKEAILRLSGHQSPH